MTIDIIQVPRFFLFFLAEDPIFISLLLLFLG